MAKSNCPAEDSAPPQASAGQLTPRFLPLSLSGRLLQVTVAISPSAAKGASKGPDKFLPARVVLSFGGKVRVLLYDFAGWGAVVFCRKSSLLATFLNDAFAGDLPA